MKHLGSYIGVSKQTEVLVLVVIGILCTIFDASLLDLQSNLYKVWDIRMDPARFSDKAELYMKYTLSAVVLIRTFTVHVYLGCYIVLLYPAVFEERPSLILPWLVTSAVKCLFTGLVAFLAGFYTCMAYTFTQPTCWEFLLSQAVDHIPSIYVFILVLSYYQDLKDLNKLAQYIEHTQNSEDMLRRRRKTRFMSGVIDNTDMAEIMNYYCNFQRTGMEEDVLLHIQTESRCGNTRSLDTLLNHLKNDEARDVNSNIYDDAFDADQSLTVEERTARLLQITEKDIQLAKSRRQADGEKVHKSLSSIQSTAKTANPFESTKGEMMPLPSESIETEVCSFFPEEEMTVTPVLEWIKEERESVGNNIINDPRKRSTGVDSQLQTNTHDIDDANEPIIISISSKQLEAASVTTSKLPNKLANWSINIDPIDRNTYKPHQREGTSTQNSADRSNKSTTAKTDLCDNEKKCKVIHKNTNNFRNSYKDDGYTQAYIDSLMTKHKM